MIVKTLIYFLLYLAFVQSCYAQQILDSQLRCFPTKEFLNKPIDSLIAKLPVGYDSSFYIGSACSINKGATLQISYPPDNEYWIIIRITDPHFITVNKSLDTPPEIAWPLSLLRKEKIGAIVIGRAGYEIIQDVNLY